MFQSAFLPTRAMALLLCSSLVLTSLGPLPLRADDQTLLSAGRPSAYDEYSARSPQSQSFSPEYLEQSFEKQEAFVALQNTKLNGGRPADGVSQEGVREYLRQNLLDKFITQEEMGREAEKSRRKASQALSALGFRYKLYPDGKKVWLKGGKTHRIENETVRDPAGRVSRRDTFDMTYDGDGNLTAYKTETTDPRGHKRYAHWDGVYENSAEGRQRLSSFKETHWDALGNISITERRKIQSDAEGRVASYEETNKSEGRAHV